MLKNFSKMLVAVVTVLLLSGCVEVEYKATFNADEKTINGSYQVLLDKSFLQMYEEGDENFDKESFLGDLTREDSLKGKVEVETISTDSHEGFISTFTEVEYADFITLFGDGAEYDTSITVIEPGVVKFEANFGTFKTEDGNHSNHSIIGFHNPKVDFSLTFPGGIIEHRGGVVSEDNKSITVDLLEENPNGFFVTGNVNVNKDKNIASIIALIIIIIIMIVLVVLAKRKEATDAFKEQNKEEKTTTISTEYYDNKLNNVLENSHKDPEKD